MLKRTKRMRNRDRADRHEKKGRGRFQYRQRDASTVKDHANQQSGNWDIMFSNRYKMFIPEAKKKYRIRILPPTWDDDAQKGMGYEIWRHSSVGADNQRYLCLRLMKNEDCPVCEESDDLKREAGGDRDSDEDKASYKLKAKKGYVYWIVVRGEEDEGPQLWAPTWQIDRDINGLCEDDETGETLFIDHPDEGYDVLFSTVKKGRYTECIKFKLSRHSSPISDDQDQQDEWLKFIQKRPVPSAFVFYDKDHIDKVLSGGKARDDDDDEDDEDSTRSSRRRRKNRDDDDDDDRPSRRSMRDEDEDEIDDEDEDLDGDDDDDEDTRKSSRKRSRRRDDDDDEDDESEDDDEERDSDAEDRRKRSSKGVSSSGRDRSKKRPHLERETPKRRMLSKLKSRRRDEDDDDEE